MYRNRAVLISGQRSQSFYLYTLPSAAHFGSDPWHQVEVSTADKDPRPKSQFSAIYGHPKNVEFRFED